jgi:hypothetical protein
MRTRAGDRPMELSNLHGRELAAVVFIRDYVELLFDGPVLTAITLPRVMQGHDLVGAGDAGYRDALCGQIGKVVTTSAVREKDAVEVVFADGATITISLRDEDYVTAEAAKYADDRGGVWVW